jgi:hypothetical protein
MTQMIDSNRIPARIGTLVYPQVLYASARGNLYEVNPRLVDEPGLLSGDGDTEVCYLAIIMPKHSEKKTVTEKLLTQEEYDNRMVAAATVETGESDAAASAAPAAAMEE